MYVALRWHLFFFPQGLALSRALEIHGKPQTLRINVKGHAHFIAGTEGVQRGKNSLALNPDVTSYNR